MPHFTLQLEIGGPILNAAITVSGPRRAALEAAELPIPEPVVIRALVDTGASCTCVDPSVLAKLNLTSTGVATLATPSTGTSPHQAPQYDVGLVIPGPPNSIPLYFDTIPVVSAQLLQLQGFHGLIGRDILSSCVLTYNGSMGQFILAF